MTSKREQIIQAASELFEMQGYHATGLTEILRRSNTPKGSLYHYFPGGKEQLAEEAVLHTGKMIAGRVKMGLAQTDDLTESFRHLMDAIANEIERSGFMAGGPLTAIAMETTTSNERLNLACRRAFDLIREPIEDRLRAGGAEQAKAASLASFIVAVIEGGTLLSRTQHSGEPLRKAARQMAVLLKAEIN